MPLEQTFGKMLAARLDADAPPGLRCEVINAGVSGWGTDQQLLWFQAEGVKYRPDLVVLAFFPGNDFQNVSEALEVANMGRIQKPFFDCMDDELKLRYYPFEPAAISWPPLNRESAPATAGATSRQLTGVRAWLKSHSAFYRFAATVLDETVSGLALRLAGWGLIDAPNATATAAMGPPTCRWPTAHTVGRWKASGSPRALWPATWWTRWRGKSLPKAAG